jgi:hypothetical protein
MEYIYYFLKRNWGDKDDFILGFKFF